MANATAASNVLRRGFNLLAPLNTAIRRPVSRSVHSTGCKKMAEHGEHSEPFYLHAEHMYNLDRMKHQKLKMGIAVWTCFSIGVGVPIFAVVFQQKKTASG